MKDLTELISKSCPRASIERLKAKRQYIQIHNLKDKIKALKKLEKQA
jgi:hypothetical protein